MRKRGGANEVIQDFHKSRKCSTVLRVEWLWKEYLVGSQKASVTPGELASRKVQREHSTERENGGFSEIKKCKYTKNSSRYFDWIRGRSALKKVFEHLNKSIDVCYEVSKCFFLRNSLMFLVS